MNNDIRDQMARAICESTSAGQLFPWDTLAEHERAPWRRMADAASAAQREACTITSAEQADALPLGAILLTVAHNPVQRELADGQWWMRGKDRPFPTRLMIGFRLLHHPAWETQQ